MQTLNRSEEDPYIERLAQQIVPDSRLLRVWPLLGGISAQMTAFEIELPGGQARKMVLRRPGGIACQQNPAQVVEQEYRTLEAVQRLGLAAPAPLFFDPGGERSPWPCFVMEWMDGAPQYAPPDRIDFARQAAEHLARIHSADLARLELSFLPQSQPACAEFLGKPPGMLNESLHEGQIREALQAALPLTRCNTSVLLHGDFWPGNLLWQGNRLTAVVDWEDASLGDPLIDLAISRLDMLWIMGDEAMRAFTTHYRFLREVDDTCLPYWDLCAALRLIRLAGANLAEWAAFFHPSGRVDITEQTMRAQINWFVRQAFDQLPRCRTE